jgi:general secretion pathway protein I
MRPPKFRPSAGAGFSLLEVLVAFMILALVATALFRLFGGALGNAAAADDWSRALLVGESRLALAASATPLREGADSGAEPGGRIRWQTRVAAYEPPETPEALARIPEASPMRLYRVSVEVRFPADNGRERELTLSTLRVGLRNPP